MFSLKKRRGHLLRRTNKPFLVEALEERVLLSSAGAPALTSPMKQSLMLQMVDNDCGAIPPELVLAEIRQEGGAGAFYVDGSDYDSFYAASAAPWAQPDDNSDGIMQVTAGSGYHQISGTYTNDQAGYEHAISDGCGYLIASFNSTGTLWQAVMQYNAGPSSLYVYMGLKGGDPQYLAHVASDLQSFVPSIYALSDANLVSKLDAAQTILNSFLNNPSIASGQSASYYATYQSQLNSQLHSLGAAGAVTDTFSGAQSNQLNSPQNWSTGKVPSAADSVEINMGSVESSVALNVGNLILSNATLQLAAGSGASTVSAITIEGGGVLDLTSNSLSINYGQGGTSPLATVAGYLSSGYNSGAWNGTGIISSSAAANPGYAVGYADGSADIGTVAKPGEVLVKYTLAGDVNLDGTVNLTDLLDLLNGYGQSGRDWAQGDMNYDGSVNLTDLLDLLNNYGVVGNLGAEVTPKVGVVAYKASSTPFASGPMAVSFGPGVLGTKLDDVDGEILGVGATGIL